MRDDERDRDLLDYIRESIDRVNEYRGEGMTAMVEDAILRRLETLADAAGRLSDSLRLSHPEIPWPRVVGFRNVLAHGYTSIEWSAVERVIDDYLPALRSVAERELERLSTKP